MQKVKSITSFDIQMVYYVPRLYIIHRIWFLKQLFWLVTVLILSSSLVYQS